MSLMLTTATGVYAGNAGTQSLSLGFQPVWIGTDSLGIWNTFLRDIGTPIYTIPVMN